jgi:cation diffusion facilitator family transporter
VRTEDSLEFPSEKEAVYRKAVRLEWLTIAYLSSAIFFLFLTLGNSQAMKAAWIEDILSLAPPAAFLVAGRLRRRRANDRFPWGYHRSVSIAYLAAALAILLLGSFVFFDSAAKLVTAEHPPIGLVEVFGIELWLGWPMLMALAWSAGPAVLLGRAKLPLAQALHDKVLYADSKMNKADWLTASAAMVGVVGIGFGLWWADAVAAIAISLDIIHDGYTNLRAAVADLMDSRPTRHDSDEPHPLVDQLQAELRKREWVKDVKVRLREEGHVFAGEAHVVPVSEERLLENIARGQEELLELDWRLQDFVISPVRAIERAPEPTQSR